MTQYQWGWVIWGSWLFGYFCTMEGLAAFGRKLGLDVPWPTLSWWFWRMQQIWPFVSVAAIALFAILASHLVRTKNVQEGE